jgi:ParB family chromosome partitioning protein
MGDPAGYVRMDWAVDGITVGARHRKDLGDISALAGSIRDLGLLQPLTITPEGVLVCGARRLAAIRSLGWRQVDVWVKHGLSGRLSALMAERDDNFSHKQYTKVELADLYQELKDEIAADAARRQEASRFQAGERNPRSHGAGKFPAPSRAEGDTREQAAAMLGGQASYKTLDKVTAIRALGVDAGRSDALRRAAADALRRIDAGCPVDPEYVALRDRARIEQFERAAADESQPDEARRKARQGAVLLAKLAAGEGLSDAEADHAAQIAWDQVHKAAARAKKAPAPKPAAAPRRKATAKEFEWLWGQIADWADDHDPRVVAAQVPDPVWAKFKRTVAATVAFMDTVDQLRATRAARAHGSSPA